MKKNEKIMNIFIVLPFNYLGHAGRTMYTMAGSYCHAFAMIVKSINMLQISLVWS